MGCHFIKSFIKQVQEYAYQAIVLRSS